MKKRIKMLVSRLNATDTNTFADAISCNPTNSKINNSGNRYVYIDNGSNVLAVAHVDTVEDSPRYYYSADKKIIKYDILPSPKVENLKVTSIKLDDRLGVHLILDILPMMGINVDVLLTDDEEFAQSSAIAFVTDKVYNWAFSFDRRGIGEVVMYQYSSDLVAIKAVEDSGWYFGRGSYSDISDLDIGCSCFNFSAGYMNEHTDACFCQYDGVMYNAQLFKKFYNAHKDTRFPYTYTPKTIVKYDSKKWEDTTSTSTKWTAENSDWKDDDDWKKYSKKYASSYQECSYCGKVHSTTYDTFGNPICDSCYLELQPTKECVYCGMEISVDGALTPEVEDSQFEEICVSCGTWLRENVPMEDWSSFSIKVKKGKESK
jgi:hypothetical protein